MYKILRLVFLILWLVFPVKIKLLNIGSVEILRGWCALLGITV